MNELPPDLAALSTNHCSDVQKQLQGPMADAVRATLYDLCDIAEDFVKRVLYLRQHGERMPEPEPTDPKEKMGRMLREARKKTGKTCEGVSGAVGKDLGWLSKVERGERPISHQDLKNLVDHYGVDPRPFMEAFALLRSA